MKPRGGSSNISFCIVSFIWSPYCIYRLEFLISFDLEQIKFGNHSCYRPDKLYFSFQFSIGVMHQCVLYCFFQNDKIYI